MAIITITIKVSTHQDGLTQYIAENTFDLDVLRATPNPREALASTFKTMAQAAINEVDPTFIL